MPNHAPLTFSVPKPPSKQSTRDNPDETQAWINKRLVGMITKFKKDTAENPDLGLAGYMVMYSTIHQYIVETRDHVGDDPEQRLYDGLAHAVRSHCKDVRTEMLQSHSSAADKDLAILEAYAREWRRHCKLAKIVAHNYRYLERHWITREQDYGKRDVYPLLDLHSLIWREEVAIGSSQSGQESTANIDDFESILDIAVRLREREGFAVGEELGQQASDLLREVFGSFEEVGIKIGTWHATEENRILYPEVAVQHETLRSGLKITVRVPLSEPGAEVSDE